MHTAIKISLLKTTNLLIQIDSWSYRCKTLPLYFPTGLLKLKKFLAPSNGQGVIVIQLARFFFRQVFVQQVERATNKVLTSSDKRMHASRFRP